MKEKKWYIPGEGFDPKKTLKKFLYGLGYAFLLTFITYTINFLQVTEFPPEYAFYVGLGITLLQTLQNAIKHWNDAQ